MAAISFKIISSSKIVSSTIESEPVTKTLKIAHEIPSEFHQALNEASRYVGTIRSEIGIGTCFLCENGYVITPLHVIYDLDKIFQNGNIQAHSAKNILIEFLDKDNALHTFSIKRMVSNGFSVLKDSASIPS